MVLDDIRKLHDRLLLCVKIVHDIALICKESEYPEDPEDLEDIYDVLINNGIDYKNLEDNTRWL